MESRKKIASCHFFLIPSNGAGLRAKKIRARLHGRARFRAGGRAFAARLRWLLRVATTARHVPDARGAAHIMHVCAARTCYAIAAYRSRPFLRAHAKSSGKSSPRIPRSSHKTSRARCLSRGRVYSCRIPPRSIAARTRSESGSSQSQTAHRPRAMTAAQKRVIRCHCMIIIILNAHSRRCRSPCRLQVLPAKRRPRGLHRP